MESCQFPFSDTELYPSSKSSLRKRADVARDKRCRYLLAVLEQPNNITNIGAVIRNVDGLGISKLYIVGNPIEGKWNKAKLHNSSTGSSNRMYTRYFDTTKECMEHLQSRGYSSLVTSPHLKGKNNIPLREGTYSQYPKLAIWFGNESNGISQEAIDKSDGCVNIDMCGINESLNLSVSTGIALHHIASERRVQKSQEVMRKVVPRRKGRCI
jgi:tRNA (guanosine-2'-O-)-methyltransferase